MALVMGTAGHIDHGKTSLIKILTGTDCDRLVEEKKRGITIELGFAHLDLEKRDKSIERLGIIDMPGHEKFVRNMVAGAGGIDFVLMVIAADEGVMPQTREHLEICSILQIQAGIIVLTKTDMVDQELLEFAIEDVKDFTKGTFLENAPIFPVSSHTGQGIEELKAGILLKAEEIIQKPRTDIFRLPIDRVFSLKGHGTTITGTVLSGQAKLGAEIEIIPNHLKSKIRTIQNHGQSVDYAEAGHRISLNLNNLAVSDINKGDIVSLPNTLYTSKKWLMSITCLKSSPKPIKHRKEIHFHHATKEVLARLYFYPQLDDSLPKDQKNEQSLEIKPGETALCEVHFQEPMSAIFGDKCIIRSFSPLQTIAGAEVINPLGNFPKRSKIDTTWQNNLLNIQTQFKEKKLEQVVYTQIFFNNPHGIEFNKLLVLTDLSEKLLEKSLQTLANEQKIHTYDKEKKVQIAKEHFENLCKDFLTQLENYHEKEAHREFMPKAVIFSNNLDIKLNHFILDKLAKQGKIITNNDGVRLKSHNIALKEFENKLKEQIEQKFNSNITNPPLVKELVVEFKTEQKEVLKVLQLLIQEKKIIKIVDNMYFNFEYIQKTKENIINFLKSNQGMAPSDFKDLSDGLTRKYSIPVLEYFDKEKITIRVGDVRQLRQVKSD